MLQPVANNHHSIKFDKCNLWIHTKCNKINKQAYNSQQTETSVTATVCHVLKSFYPS